MTVKNRKVTLPVAFGFGLTDIIGGGAFTIIGAWLLYFYTTFVGLSPLEAASIMAIARIIDAVISLFMGSITDNFYKNRLGARFGRRRFFLLIGAPLMLCYSLLWVTGMNYFFYLMVYLAFEIVVAVVMIPWETLPSEMSTDYKERTRLSTCRMFLSALGTFLATFIPGILIRHFGEDNSQAYFYNGLFFATVFMLCVLVSWASSWERPLTPEMIKELENKRKPQQRQSIWRILVNVSHDYISTLKVRAFRKHLAIYLLSFTGKDVFNTVLVFFCVYCLMVPASLAAGLLSLSIIGLPVTLIAGFAFVRFGPRVLFSTSYLTMLVCLAALLVIYLIDPASKIAWLYGIAALYQVGRCLLEFTPWNVFPFIPDVDELICRKRREGLFAAVMTFSRKTTVAIATLFIGLGLQWGGFEKGATTQSAHAVLTIAVMLFVGTGGLLLLALAIAQTLKLDKRNHGILVAEIERLQNGGDKTAVEAETREVVEDLTGYPYEELWPVSKENASGSFEPAPQTL